MGPEEKLNPEDAGAGEDPSEELAPMIVPNEKPGLLVLPCGGAACENPSPGLAVLEFVPK